MTDKDYDIYERKRYVIGKLTGEALLATGSSPIARALDTFCEKKDWAADYINQRTDDTRGAACDGLRDALEEHLGELQPETPQAVATNSDERSR